jgi:vacuolar-type H+-ATPase subunit H
MEIKKEGDAKMVDIERMLKPELSETDDIFQEYRKEISATIEKIRARSLERARSEAQEIVQQASDDANSILAQAQHKADSTMSQANQRAEKILAEVETKARDRGQREEARLIQEAREKAGQVITAAKEAAGRTANQTIDEAKKEAERLSIEIRQKAETEANLLRRKTQEEAEHVASSAREEARKEVAEEKSEIIAQARQEANNIVSQAQVQAESEKEKLIASYLENVKKKAELEKVQILFEVRFKAKEIARGIKDALGAELEKSSLLISGAQKKLERVLEGMSEESLEGIFDLNAAPSAVEADIESNNFFEVEFKQSSREDQEQEPIFEGKVELEILPPVHSGQKSLVDKLLREIPQLRIVSNGGLDDGTNWMEIELGQPTPVISFLQRMPPVKQVAAYGNCLVIALKRQDEIDEK